MAYWIEKTYSHKRLLDKNAQFKKVLLSPTKSRNNADIYRNMRNVMINDIILHLDQSVDQIVGFSEVVSTCEIITIKEEEYFRVELDNFIPYIPPINIREFFRDNDNIDSLRSIMYDNQVFYRKYKDNFALRQGAYLTKIPPALMNLLQKYIHRSKNTEIEIVREIPKELLDMEIKPNDISIIIGKNGTGKSQLLTDLVYEYLREKKTVISLSSSIFDKFSNIKKDDSNKKYFFLGAKSGPKAIVKLIINFLEHDKELNSFFQILKYIGYKEEIGLRINLSNLNTKQKKLLESLDYDLRNSIYDFQKNDEIIWINKDKHYNLNIFYKIIDLKKELHKHDISIDYDLFLSKNNLDIPLLQASSGELALLSTFVHILLYIDLNSVILIDEPENSLHPKWQKDFVSTFLKLFSNYNPKVIIATHSPILISISDFINPNTNIYIAKKDIFEKLTNKPHNHELLLMEVFDIVTPENKTLSNELIYLLNDLEDKKINFDLFTAKIHNYKNSAYDERQLDLLNEIFEIGKEIVSKK